MTRVPNNFPRDDFCTPPELLALTYAAIGVPDLDPCANKRSLVVCKRALYFEQDGLNAAWKARTVFCNPPYSQCLLWMKKFLKWYGNGGPREGVLLLNLEPGLVWWQELLLPRVGVMHFPLRVAFLANGIPVKGNRANSALMYLGYRKKLIRKVWPEPCFQPCQARPSWPPS